jgi:hypothetical protein
VPQELAGGIQRQLALEAQQVALLQEHQPEGDRRREAHDPQQRTQPLVQPLHQEVVEVDAVEGRRHQPGQQQRQAGQHHEHHRAARAREPPAQRRQQAGRLPTRRERWTRTEGQAHPGEGLVELLERGRRRAGIGVVEVRPPLPESLEDNEVVEVPVQDHRDRHRRQVGRLPLEPLRHQPVFPGRLEHVVGLTAVAGHPAGQPQFLQRHVPAEMREEHGQRGRAALDRFHLEHRRRPHPSVRTGRRRGRFVPGWRRGAAARQPGLHAGPAPGHDPLQAARQGGFGDGCSHEGTGSGATGPWTCEPAGSPSPADASTTPRCCPWRVCRSRS